MSIITPEKQREYGRKSYWKNHEKNLLRVKNWRINNPEKRKKYADAYMKEYSKLNKEAKREYDKKYLAVPENKVRRNETRLVWYEKNLESLKDYHKKWRDTHKESVRGYSVKGKYGITLEESKELLIRQDHKCALCGIDEAERNIPFYIDHDHKTGKVRGLLCAKCNTGLGQFNDDVGLLSKAITYLSL